MNVREEVILQAVTELHSRGITPTSRNVLMHLNPGKTLKSFPNGMGGNDVKYLRRSMLSLGYWQTKTGRWQPPVPHEKIIPALDEVRCPGGCVLGRNPHTLADHYA